MASAGSPLTPVQTDPNRGRYPTPISPYAPPSPVVEAVSGCFAISLRMTLPISSSRSALSITTWLVGRSSGLDSEREGPAVDSILLTKEKQAIATIRRLSKAAQSAMTSTHTTNEHADYARARMRTHPRNH